nr:MAG TPA: hypothetical protein [Caudoviricetes sp.]
MTTTRAPVELRNATNFIYELYKRPLLTPENTTIIQYKNKQVKQNKQK